MKITQCEIGYLELLDQNIILAKINDEVNICKKHILQFQQILERINADRRMKAIISQGEFSSASREAREHFSQLIQNQIISCNALIVSDLGQKIIARHELRKHNIKIFSDLSKATFWIKRVNVN